MNTPSSTPVRGRFVVAVFVALLALAFSGHVADAAAADPFIEKGHEAIGLRAPDGGAEAWRGNGSGAGNVEIKNTASSPVPIKSTVCALLPQSTLIVGTAATLVPATQLAGRRELEVCNSEENAGSPLLKCLLDGTPGFLPSPDVGVPQGDVLSPGKCKSYPVDTSHVLRCISDTAGTIVTTSEC